MQKNLTTNETRRSDIYSITDNETLGMKDYFIEDAMKNVTKFSVIEKKCKVVRLCDFEKDTETIKDIVKTLMSRYSYLEIKSSQLKYFEGLKLQLRLGYARRGEITFVCIL